MHNLYQITVTQGGMGSEFQKRLDQNCYCINTDHCANLYLKALDCDAHHEKLMQQLLHEISDWLYIYYIYLFLKNS